MKKKETKSKIVFLQCLEKIIVFKRFTLTKTKVWNKIKKKSLFSNFSYFCCGNVKKNVVLILNEFKTENNVMEMKVETITRKRNIPNDDLIVVALQSM